MKKSVATLLILTLLVGLLSIFSISASAETVGGTCGEALTWSLDTDTGKLTISGSGAMEDYAWSGKPWNS